MKGGEVMMAQGAALGAAFDLLFTSIVDASKRVASFTSQLNRLKSTLASIKPAIDDIEKLNIILDRPHNETEAFTTRLTGAQRLVEKCSKVSKWNVVMRYYYSNKLTSLESSFTSFFQIDVPALHLCETKRISVVVSDLQEKVNEIANILEKTGLGKRMSSKTIDREESEAIVENEGNVADEVSVGMMEK